jgi:2-polyprenyl-3-methyl-5-hydroxy-6-metoxy-1,4-benzoquinol methylase
MITNDIQPEATLRDQLEDVPCDLCGHKDEELLYTKPGVLTSYPFQVMRCRSCGLIYLNPRLSQKAIVELYDRDYYGGKGFDQHVNYLRDLSRDDITSKVSRPEEAVEILDELRPPPAFHLDFGCGVGDLLGQATKCGYDSEGYEVSRFAREFVQGRGFTVYGHVDEIPANRYDIVTAIEVLEHCSSPLESLRVIYRVLRPGGILYYTTCNFDGFYERFRRGKVDRVRDEYIKPEGHIHFFSTAVMELYFRKIGFRKIFRFEPRHYVREGRLFSLLSRAGFVGKNPYPDTFLLKVAYYGSRSLAVALGIRKPSLPLAQK